MVVVVPVFDIFDNLTLTGGTNYEMLTHLKIMLASGRWVAEPMCRVGWLRSLCVGRFLVHFIATSWSNLQACKISSIAEIPKLDRVWQHLS